jgi:uncharacterized delta-60 repeat protein
MKTSSLVFCLLIHISLSLPAQNAGSQDPSFGQDGQVQISRPDSALSGGFLAIQPDHKIIVVGEISVQQFEDANFFITRLLPNGQPDQTYGINGQVEMDFANRNDSPYACALQPDGKLLVAGETSDSIYDAAIVARFNTDGSLDHTFGQNGYRLFNPGNDEDVFYSILLLPDGKILLGGSTYDTNAPGGLDLLLVQLNPDGSEDSGFGNNGFVITDVTQGLEAILSLARQADGKIVAVGANAVFNYDMQLERYTAKGAIDSSFANNGVLVVSLPNGTEDVAYSVAIQPDQKIVFCGSTQKNGTTTGSATLMRLNSDGSFDPAFGNNGQVLTDFGFFEYARSLALQPDGKILVAAEGGILDTSGTYWVLRYLPDGTLDPAFGTSGLVSASIYPSQIPEATAVLLQPDGDILMAGYDYQNINVFRYQNDLVAAKEATLFHPDWMLAPNPCGGTTKLVFTLDKPGLVDAVLMDGQGRYLETLLSKTEFSGGKNEQHIQISDSVPHGSYFVVVSLDGFKYSFPVFKVGY